jgi:hypothetical protein
LQALQVHLFYKAVEEPAVKNGYKIEKNSRGGGIYRNNKLVKQSMGWGFSSRGTYIFDGFHAMSYFKDFDLEVTDILKKHHLRGGEPGKRMDDNFSPDFGPRFSFHSNHSHGIDFVSVKEVEFIVEIYQDFCCNKVIPFFNEYAHPLNVYEHVKTTDDYDKLGLGSNYKFYKSLILRKCNDDSCFDYFQSHLLKVKNRFEEYESKEYIQGRQYDDRFRNSYYAALEYNELLPTIKPIYNI